MTDAAQTNFGGQLWMAPEGETLVMIAEGIEIMPPPTDRAMVKVTTLDSEADANGGVPDEYIPDGTYDPGQVSIKLHHLPGSANYDAIMLAIGSGAKQDVQLVDKDVDGQPYAIAGAGYAASYTPDARGLSGAATATLKIQRSGVWAPVP